MYGFVCRILLKQTLRVIKTTSFKTTNLCSTKQPLNAVELKHTPCTRKRNSLLLSSLTYLPHVRITDQPLGSANERLLRLKLKLFGIVFQFDTPIIVITNKYFNIMRLQLMISSYISNQSIFKGTISYECMIKPPQKY